MKSISYITLLLISSLFFTITSCSTEQVMPIPSQYEVSSEILSRSDFSGLEEKVKIKVAERDQISINDILTCEYAGQTSEGYGRYNFTTPTSWSGIYLVTGIIGDDIDGI